MSRTLWWLLGIAGFLLFDAVFCAGVFGGSWIGSLPLYLAFGWIFYLARVLPEVSVDPSGVVTGTVSLVLLVVGVHWLGRWWVRNATRLVDGGPSVEDIEDDGRRAGPSRPAPLPRERGASFEGEPRWSVRRTVVIVGAMLLMFIAGLSGTAMVHQTAWLVTSSEPITNQAREMVWRTQSKQNLKQMGLAHQLYHDTEGSLPPGGTFDELGRGLHSWQTMLLPWVEQQGLYKRMDLEQPWQHPTNAKATSTRVPAFENPAIANSERSEVVLTPGPSHYAGNSHMLGADRGLSLREIADGASNTILAGEVKAEIKAWADPTNVRDPVLGINAVDDGFGAPWTGGAQFVLGDGAVRFISEKIDPQVLKALATPAAGDDASGDW